MSDTTEREKCAWHEAGHAVAAILAGRRVGALSVGIGGGATLSDLLDDAPEARRASLKILMAGDEAEKMARPLVIEEVDLDPYFTDLEHHLYAPYIADTPPPPPATPGQSDMESARKLAEQLSDEPEAEIALARELAWRTLALHKEALTDLARALLQWRELGEADVLAIWSTSTKPERITK